MKPFRFLRPGDLALNLRLVACGSLALLASCASTPKEEAPPAPPPPVVAPPDKAVIPTDLSTSCAQKHQKEEELLDATKRRMHETVCGAVLWFDGLFGDRTRDTIKSARGVYGRVETYAAYSQFFGWDTHIHFTAHADLPNLQHKVSAFIGREPENQAVQDREEGFALRSQFPELDDHDETIAGLGYTLPDNYFFQSDFRVGVRFAGINVPKAFAQWRFALNAYSDESNLIDLRTTPFINTKDGLGDTTSVDYSHVLGETLLLRWNNVGTRTQKSPGVGWRSVLTLYQGLENKRGLAYQAYMRGATQIQVPLTEYGVQLVYRQPIFSERLYIEGLTGYSWPKLLTSQPREGSYNVGMALELPFGKGEGPGFTAQPPPIP